jgi:hypothetical protein
MKSRTSTAQFHSITRKIETASEKGRFFRAFILPNGDLINAAEMER